MKSINQVLKEKGVESPWRGSEKTAEQMREQIRERFGEKVAKTYDPKTHVMSLRHWSRFGVRIKPGESALRTYTLIENDQKEEGEQKSIRRTIPVFHYLQTDLAAQHD
jgi:hypothetical protein